MKYNFDHIEELKDFREYMRYTQEQLADVCNFEVSLIRRIEQGHKSISDLTIKQFNRLAYVIFDFDMELCKHFLELYTFLGLTGCSIN